MRLSCQAVNGTYPALCFERIALLERKLASLQYSVQHIIRLMESAGTRDGSNNGY